MGKGERRRTKRRRKRRRRRSRKKKRKKRRCRRSVAKTDVSNSAYLSRYSFLLTRDLKQTDMHTHTTRRMALSAGSSVGEEQTLDQFVT